MTQGHHLNPNIVLRVDAASCHAAQPDPTSVCSAWGKHGTELYDRVLVAVGRRPASRGIGLENTNVQVDQRGFVVCNEHQRTADPHILAIGDVAGEPMLAHKASHEAKVAVETILGKNAVFRPAAIPAVVFTDPEIAWAGLTEAEAKRDGIAHGRTLRPLHLSAR